MSDMLEDHSKPMMNFLISLGHLPLTPVEALLKAQHFNNNKVTVFLSRSEISYITVPMTDFFLCD